MFTRDEIVKISNSPAKFMALDVKDRRMFIVDFINEFPEKHDQDTWGSAIPREYKRPNAEMSCGTAALCCGLGNYICRSLPCIW